MAQGLALINTGVSRYSDENLTAAKHLNELEPSGEIFFNIDHRMGGLGNNSCGPGVRPDYMILPGGFAYGIRLRPLEKDTNPATEGRKGIEGIF